LLRVEERRRLTKLWRLLSQHNSREHTSVYVLATASNLFLSIPECLAVRAALLSNLPVGGSPVRFIATYGVGLGLVLDFLWTLLIFQGLLAVLVVAVAASTVVEKGWRWVYVFSALVLSGFMGYWLGERFFLTLSWVSSLENAGVNSSGVYSELFWYGLGATFCYVAMILVLRRSHNKLVTVKTGLLG